MGQDRLLLMMSISSGKKEIDMNIRNAPNSGIAAYLLIAFGLAWISLAIRWGMFRIAAVVCA
jgi:hypothetical protein